MASDAPTDEVAPNLDDADLETLRNAFVEAYNARDLEAILEIVSADAELPDGDGEGHEALADAVQAYWERSPMIVLTNARIDDAAAAMAWTPDEYGHWTRVGLVTFDSDEGLLTVIELFDDATALQAALADDPVGDIVAEELDWSEWDRGEPTGDGDGDWHERQLPESWSS